MKLYEPRREKPCLWGFRQGPTTTAVEPPNMAKGLEISDLVIRGSVLSKGADMSCAVTAQFCVFVFAYAKNQVFS